MRPATHPQHTSTVRADALFVSALQRSEHPGAGQVRRAVTAAVRAFGERGCAGRVAQEFGDHPEIAASRMRWARQLAGEAFGDRALNAPAPASPAAGWLTPARPRKPHPLH